GYNGLGGLGTGDENNRTTPTPILVGQMFANVATSSHTCAITSGEVYCWGRNTDDECGAGSNPQPPFPVGSGYTQVAAGGAHTCAVVATGGVKCWGYNGY